MSLRQGRPRHPGSRRMLGRIAPGAAPLPDELEGAAIGKSDGFPSS
ncbi:Hypothetical protein CAP_1854 [Chondromyces apiculatus DSM 436]|uniref:Uncharacterized protein n=1 Tax=Chondromyces apiculatus DSM 436 TaxID=1192034 RepID=A0A017ST98_9BACT|nr:Hypothetical protein CAP_1854 [Chondromyces apiculatus DSM 436]